MTWPLHFFLVALAGWINQRQQTAIEFLRAENRLLRARLGPGRILLNDAERRTLARKGHALGRKGLAEVASIASPETILRWYRELVAAKYDASARRRPGRPRTKRALVELVLNMANENPTWGYTRICGALRNLDCRVSRTTIRRILADNGIHPAPERKREVAWSTFLKAHWGAVAAADFFSVEVLNAWGLTRYLVFFVIDLKSRCVHIAGIHHQPCGRWMEQVARNLTDAYDGFLGDKRILIVDRDPLYTEKFRALLASAGIDLVRLPPRSPNLNAFAERFVGSIRRECLHRIVPLGERHLRNVITQYVEHYHAERNHQALGNRLLRTQNPATVSPGHVIRRQRLGGILNFYHRNAA